MSVPAEREKDEPSEQIDKPTSINKNEIQELTGFISCDKADIKNFDEKRAEGFANDTSKAREHQASTNSEPLNDKALPQVVVEEDKLPLACSMQNLEIESQTVQQSGAANRNISPTSGATQAGLVHSEVIESTQRSKACRRCPYFNRGKKSSCKPFYCDVGLRSVNRQIRQHLINRLRAHSADLDLHTVEKGKREQQLIQFFDDEIIKSLGTADDVVEKTAAEKGDKLSILKFFLDTDDASVSALSGCKRKRSKKGEGKNKSYYRSSFDGFKQTNFTKLQGNKLLDVFFKYLDIEAVPKMMREYDEELRSCRVPSYAAVIKLSMA